MEQRLIDANALQLEPQNGAMNGVLFMGRATGKTLSLVQSCLNAMISNAPTVDAVEVVRCKDCEYRLHPTGMCMNPMAMGLDALEPTDSDFCSRGKRRDECSESKS